MVNLAKKSTNKGVRTNIFKPKEMNKNLMI